MARLGSRSCHALTIRAELAPLAAGVRMSDATNHFMPHGYCFLWTPGVLWTHVISDVLIAMAYFAIPFVMLHIRARRRDLPFDWLIVCFSIFIVTCGLTH